MHCVRKRTKRGYDIDFTFMASKNRDPFKDPFEIELYFNKYALPPQLQHKIRMIQELNSIIFRRRWEVSGRTIEGATKSVRCLQFSEYNAATRRWKDPFAQKDLKRLELFEPF